MNELANAVDPAEDENNADQLMEDLDEIYKCLLSYRLQEGASANTERPAVDGKIWATVKRMWSDTRVKDAFYTGTVRLRDSAGYVLEHLERISKPNYSPTNDDMLRMGRKTSGSSEIEFDVETVNMMNPNKPIAMHANVIVVGGQQAREHTEWGKHSNNLDAVVYVCALSEYDTERSDDKKNVLQSQLDTLKDVRAAAAQQQ